MEKTFSLADKWNELVSRIRPEKDTSENLFYSICLWIYRLRRFFLVIPVLIYAFQLANQNMQLLPEQVGINLLSTGGYERMIARSTAVYGPLSLTAGCLGLMFFTRRPLYPWLISIFTLVLPWLIRLTNLYFA